ncbi:hypothetical protein C1645_712077 [Glomus cerebriforme]|uniref:Calponin homology domain-containing protein n=1 Tax=Glomus cerebriforme TaxID=658196 RepID=A0A397T6B2_9GLOM|nr:hypothetical protein C1645_712077 [Glomus cerebriforme]
MISKFHQMISVFEVTEEELNQVEERFKESELITHNDAKIEEPEELIYEDTIENQSTKIESTEDQSIDNQLTKNKSTENDAIKPTLRNNSVRNRILSNSNNRLSLPPNYNSHDGGKRNFNPNSPTRFRTLRLKSSSSSPTNSSPGLLFWINMQLIDYTSILPLTCYPIEDFIGMNDGIILAALIHHLNMEWIDDFDILIKDKEGESEIDKEIRIKERLTKCFNIINDRLNITQPKALISMLIEKDYSDKERLKRTGLAWSVFISEIFLSITHTRSKKKEMRRQSKLILLDENEEITEFNETEETSSNKIESNNNSSTRLRECPPSFRDNNSTSPLKRNSMATSDLPPLPPWAPKASLISAVWDWTLSWMINDNDNNYDSDDYDQNSKLKEKEMRTISRGNLTSKSKQSNWDIKNTNEWQNNKNESDNDSPLQLLANTHQPAHWN